MYNSTQAYKVRCLAWWVEIATKPPPNAKLAVLISINDALNFTNSCVKEMFSMWKGMTFPKWRWSKTQRWKLLCSTTEISTHEWSKWFLWFQAIFRWYVCQQIPSMSSTSCWVKLTKLQVLLQEQICFKEPCHCWLFIAIISAMKTLMLNPTIL
jgi:hypothetical protein